jgi:hypothetical protein
MSETLSPSEKAARDNRADQLNPKHPAYWQSRGLPQPPPAPPQAPDKPKQG